MLAGAENYAREFPEEMAACREAGDHSKKLPGWCRIIPSHVPADVAAAALKLQPSWSVEHVSSWQEGIWRNVDDDLLLEACHVLKHLMESCISATGRP
jgi:hypothetical protein